MPYMINLHGIVKMVHASDVESATQHGLRLVDDLDIATLQGLQNNDFFSVHNVQGFEKGALGTQPVYVRGKGPSASAAGPSSAFTIDVNRIIDSNTGIVVALDTIAWDTIPHVDGVVRYAPKGFEGPGTRDFTLPMRTGNITINEEQAITKAHFTGIAAVLLALYITNGPVIISGFDLSGNDAGGKSYEAKQLGAWNAAFRMWNPDSNEVSGRVFCHQEQARNFGAPVWYEQSEQDSIRCVGSGPSSVELDNLPSNGFIGTANAGINRIANPRFYWLTDAEALRRHRIASTLRSKLFDTEIINGEKFPYKTEPENFHGRAAGILIMKYMIATCKPKKVYMCGYDGYVEGIDNPMPRVGMNQAMASALKRVFKENPDIEFDWICSGPLKQMVERL